MALIVNTNVEAINAQRNLGLNNSKLARSIKRLSSGLRINSAADDAAGLSIATKFATQVRGIGQAIRNGNNAISLVQVAEGAISTTTGMLQRLRELAVQAASDDNTAADRALLSKEVSNLTDELTRIGTTTEFNTQKLLDGSFNNRIFQVGANTGQTISLSIGNLSSSGIGGRAEFEGNIQDGVVNGANAGFVAGEFKVDGTNVAATKEADDQFSVLEIQSDQLSAGTSALSGLTFNINGVSVLVTLTDVGGDNSGSGLAGATIAADVQSAVNGAAITNVAVRLVGTAGFAFVATDGENLDIGVAAGVGATQATVTSDLALAAASVLIGSGILASNAVTTFNGESSSIAKAVAINAIQTDTGVTATAQNTTVTSDALIGVKTVAAGTFIINGIDIGGFTAAALDSDGAVRTAINGKATQTGVTASINSAGNLILTAKDGRNITLSFADDDTGDKLGFAIDTDKLNESLVFRGNIKLNSVDAFTLTVGSDNLSDLDETSTGDKTIAKDVTKFNVAKIKVDTQANAADALLTIDSALNDINKLRADLGATQNRIEFSITNLEVARENASASESRIRDVDFAEEVAIFTKNQILVQAGAAMLAQANTLPQIALQLLQ